MAGTQRNPNQSISSSNRPEPATPTAAHARLIRRPKAFSCSKDYRAGYRAPPFLHRRIPCDTCKSIHGAPPSAQSRFSSRRCNTAWAAFLLRVAPAPVRAPANCAAFTRRSFRSPAMMGAPDTRSRRPVPVRLPCDARKMALRRCAIVGVHVNRIVRTCLHTGLTPMQRSELKSTMPSLRWYIAVNRTDGDARPALAVVAARDLKYTPRVGNTPFSTYLTHVRLTPTGTWFSVLHATVQAWHPMHLRLSMTKRISFR